MHRIISCLLLSVICLACDVHAQNKNQSDKRDEKKENERVERAQKAIRVEQQKLQPLLNDLRAALRAESQAEKDLAATLAEVRLQREAAEERLEEKSGFPQLLRKQRELRAKYDLVKKPIIERVQSSAEWKSAKSEADKANLAKQRINDDVALDAESLEQRQASFDAVSKQPQLLEAKAIDADGTASALRKQLDDNAAKLAEMRQTFDDKVVLADPRVKSAIEAGQKAKQAVASAAEKVASIRSRVYKQQVSVVRANKELAEAKQADAKDRNQPKSPGKKK